MSTRIQALRIEFSNLRTQAKAQRNLDSLTYAVALEGALRDVTNDGEADADRDTPVPALLTAQRYVHAADLVALYPRYAVAARAQVGAQKDLDAKIAAEKADLFLRLIAAGLTPMQAQAVVQG